MGVLGVLVADNINSGNLIPPGLARQATTIVAQPLDDGRQITHNACSEP
jgi:hypothetical protein